ncbi:MBL fold metallo-hydrolase [Halobacterium bonnevillei]|uniref:MBL fold metallo-hydrolase n=1 Tax=Halobacterium bonnevillei TaxID=2692200 RepID=A0A6B0SNV4_9EURY|nr:MBL fold metallo-hydrolase [Halobacterium bonnevillei]MXR21331.1 MBL fold metallo-hydrolase [Halobacterium bonnevillei]
MIDRFAVPVETRAPGGATNAYVLGDEERVLVDPAGQTPELDDAAADVDHVAVTHTHPDHVGAVRASAAAADATVWAFAPFADRFEATTGVAPDRCFRPGDELGASGVTAMATPGHAPDHVAFCVGGEAVTGDLVFADSSVFVGTPDGDMRAYLASLRRAAARDFDRLHPGHGDVVDSPRERLHELYAHRRDRERRVLDAVRRGSTAVPDVVGDAYAKDLRGFEDLAAASVRAHLEKLAVEGRIEWDGERATPT